MAEAANHRETRISPTNDHSTAPTSSTTLRKDSSIGGASNGTQGMRHDALREEQKAEINGARESSGSFSVSVDSGTSLVDVDEGPPVLQNFSGKWKVDDEHSDRLDTFFQSLGVNWLARKIVCAVGATYEIQHTPDTWDQKDITRFGTHHARYVLDGQYHEVPQPGGKAAPARAWQSDTGDVVIETRLQEGRGTTVDCRRLIKRTRLQQILSVWREGRMDHQSRREWEKIETPAERRAAREVEAKARQEATKSTVTSSNLCIFGMWRARRQPSTANLNVPAREKSSEGEKKVNEAALEPDMRKGVASKVVHADFTGEWHIDWNLSEKMGPYLKELGVPWYARSIAENLDIVNKVSHYPYDFPAKLQSEDSSKFGTQTTVYNIDCQPKTVTGDDGKTILRRVEPLTEDALKNGTLVLMSSEDENATQSLDSSSNNPMCSLQDIDAGIPKVPVSKAIEEGRKQSIFSKAWDDGVSFESCPTVWVPQDMTKSKSPIVGLRVCTVLPENVGVTVETRHLTRNGECLRQILDLFREGKHKVRVIRLLKNHDFEKQHTKVKKLVEYRRRMSAGESLERSNETVGDSRSSSRQISSESMKTPVLSAGGVQDQSPEDQEEGTTTAVSSSDESVDHDSDGSGRYGTHSAAVNFSGIWEVDWGRSQRLDGLFQSMGLNWIARKIVSALDIKYHIAQTPIEWYVREVSSVGVFEQRLLLDGRWHMCKQQDGAFLPMRVIHDRSTGDVEVETLLLRDKKNPNQTNEVVKSFEKKGVTAALGLAEQRIRTYSTGSSNTHSNEPQADNHGQAADLRYRGSRNSVVESSNSNFLHEGESIDTFDAEDKLWTIISSKCARLLNVLHLHDRTVIRQVFIYETADGIARQAATRFLMKVESAAERLAAVKVQKKRSKDELKKTSSRRKMRQMKSGNIVSLSSLETPEVGVQQAVASARSLSVFELYKEAMSSANGPGVQDSIFSACGGLSGALTRSASECFTVESQLHPTSELALLFVVFSLFLALILLLRVLFGVSLGSASVGAVITIFLVRVYKVLQKSLWTREQNLSTST